MEFASVSCSWPPLLPVFKHSIDTEFESRIFSGCKVVLVQDFPSTFLLLGHPLFSGQLVPYTG